tara:strand:+ start:623 stop:844 length:222 start_codon:yes stop_codon:yes gene_type:complete
MATSPRWKVYTAEGEYIASVKHPKYGAMILAGIGVTGTTIRDGLGGVIFIDFVDADASNSYDTVRKWQLRAML